MKYLNILFITSLVIVNTPFVSADIRAELSTCKAIQSNTDRLQCFDQAVKDYQSEVLSISIATKNNSLLVIENSTTPAKSTLKPKKETKAAESSKFGMEFADQDAEVDSFLVGEFTSWKKGMKLKLKNGQIWKVVNARSGYKKMTNPAITISRGFFGSFDAKIEGLNAKVKVKRIR